MPPLRSGFEGMGDFFQWIVVVATASEMSQRVREHEAIGAEDVPLDGVHELMEVQRLIVRPHPDDEVEVAVRDAGAVQLLEIRELMQTERRERRLGNDIHLDYRSSLQRFRIEVVPEPRKPQRGQRPRRWAMLFDKGIDPLADDRESGLEG